jgi:tRNA(Ile)-lysidine synthase
LYDVPVHPLAQQLLAHIRRAELLKPGDRVGVAVSGGSDSVALLRLLLELREELGIVLSVVHFNHKLRGADAEADEEFVRNLAQEHDLAFYVDRADVAAHAREEGVSVETAARELRYRFFRSLIRSGNSAEEVNKPTRPLREPQRQRWGDREFETALSPGSPQGLKPSSPQTPLRGAEAPLVHDDSGQKQDFCSQEHIRGAAGRRALPKLDKVATGHTLDDQAETVLMRIIRGAGLRGIGGIYRRIAVEDGSGEIVRPLLEIRRCELQQYLQEIGQSWREDSTNAEIHFTRNRVRKLLLPLLEKEFNPAVAENLAELAEIARTEEDYWENEVAGWMGTGVHWFEPDWLGGHHSHLSQKQGEVGHPLIQIAPASSSDRDSKLRSKIDAVPWLVMNASVDRLWFLSEPTAVQRRLIKAIGEHAGIPLEFKHVEGILRFAAEDAGSGKELSLPSGWQVAREPDQLIFLTPDLREDAAHDYEYELPVPGAVTVPEVGVRFEARITPADEQARYNPERLLDTAPLSGPLRVRNWRPGDRFWPVHTKSPKKIKELLQKIHAAHFERRLWPVVASGDEVLWVRGLPRAAQYPAKPGREALLITEKPLVAPERK